MALTNGLNIMGSMMIQMTFSSIAQEIADSYGHTSTFMVNGCAIAFIFLNIPMTVVSIWAFQTFSITSVMRVGAILQFAGSLFRMVTFINGEFWPVLVGTCFVAAAKPIFISSASMIANRWFADNERATSQVIQDINAVTGPALIIIISGIVFSEEDRDSRQCLYKLMMIQNIILTVSSIIFITVM